MSNKIHVFTDCDLDGAGAYLVLSLLLKKKLTYSVTRVVDVQQKMLHWIKTNDIKTYDHVYILDLDLSQYPDVLLAFDQSNVTVIDHHKSHIDNKDEYRHARTIIESEGSTTKLIYKHFQGKQQLSEQQKLLVLMVNDYDSYKFNVPNSYELNIVFWSYQGDRVEKFVTEFGHGFVSFSEQHKNIIKFYLKKLSNIKSNLNVHYAYVPIKGKKRKMMAVFAESCINDIAEHILQNYKSDIVFVVNLKSNKVSLRRSKDCEIDLSNLAKKLFDEGGGHEDASGGVICEKFMTFSKIFQPMKIHNFDG